jgi:hypothetical protein
MAIVIRLLRGEPLELVARETNWRERALAGAVTGLKERDDPDGRGHHAPSSRVNSRAAYSRGSGGSGLLAAVDVRLVPAAHVFWYHRSFFDHHVMRGIS